MQPPAPEPEVMALGDAVLALRDARKPVGVREDGPYVNDPIFVSRLTIYATVSGKGKQDALANIRRHYTEFVAARDAAVFEDDVACAMDRAWPNYSSINEAGISIIEERRRTSTAAYRAVLVKLGLSDSMTPHSVGRLHQKHCEKCGR